MARILVVEDNQANMKLACLLLRSSGHTVLCAVDAETGLTLARTDQPHLILMDIQLPGMDGLAATAILKQDPATAAIPVVALTAMAMKADEEKTLAAGCDAYIAKPLRYQELFAVIDSLLEKGERRAADAQDRRESARPSPPDSDTSVAPLPPEGSLRKGPLILVAEDNPTNQKVIVRQLALLGFSADVVGTGRLALERWESGKYALLLTDLQMPGMDGYELIEAIRAREKGAIRIPIVVMTASSSKRDAERFRTPDMDDYLSKPLQLSELKATLDTWLPSGASLAAPAREVEIHSAGGQAVDVGALERLIGDDPAVLLEFQNDFRTGAARIATKLRAACEGRHAARAGQHAHNLKSSARSVGALALGELCAEMETAGKAENPDILMVLLPLFEKELAAVNAFLDALKAQSGVRLIIE
jgi:CheY-like chemotaxis protein/HPt (histidine-containing phosphotransfer) domain-containing protein